MKHAVAALLATAPLAAGQYDTVIPGPVCAKFKQFTVEGVGEFVDTDGSGLLGGQTTGDMSISFSLTGKPVAGQYPNQSVFRNINLDMNAVCVVKQDQGFVPTDAPVCLYEAKMKFCRNYLIFADPIKVELMPAGRVVSPDKIMEAIRVLDGGRRLA